MHATGLTLVSIALFLVAAATAFIFVNQSVAVIRQAQPTFLYILMLGCALMTSSIFTFSFDKVYGWTDASLDRACLSAPWLVSLGYIFIYSALFMKLWRLNKVLSFRRRKVKVRQVFGPFLVICLCTVAVLIAWSVIDPLSWKRTEINEATEESYGRCISRHANTFLIPLVALMGISTSACAVMAWITKDVDSRFAESKFIFYTIFVQIQVLMLGVPVLVILEFASANTTYLDRSMLVFLVVMTVVILMIGPKVNRVYSQRNKARSITSDEKCSPESGHSSVGERRRGTYGQVTVTGLNMTPSQRQLALARVSMSSDIENSRIGTSSEISSVSLDLKGHFNAGRGLDRTSEEPEGTQESARH